MLATRPRTPETPSLQSAGVSHEAWRGLAPDKQTKSRSPAPNDEVVVVGGTISAREPDGEQQRLNLETVVPDGYDAR